MPTTTRLKPKQTLTQIKQNRERKSTELRNTFSGSSIDKPVPAKKVKDFISPLVIAIAEKEILDEEGEPRVFVALPEPVIGILKYPDKNDISENKFIQEVTINEIRKYWGSVSCAIRIDIPFAIKSPNTEINVLFSRAPKLIIHSDKWVDDFFTKKYEKKYAVSISNNVKKIGRKTNTLEEGLKDIKIMLQQLGGRNPEKIHYENLLKIYKSHPTHDNGCIVTINLGISFRMEHDFESFWVLCSQGNRINEETIYPNPESLSHDHIKNILKYLYNYRDEPLYEYLDKHSDIKEYIIN